MLPTDIADRAWPVSTRIETLWGAERHESMWHLRPDGTRTAIVLPTHGQDSRDQLAGYSFTVADLPSPVLDPEADPIAALRREHPRARVTPPFRQVHCALSGLTKIRALDQVVIMLPSGYFLGYVTRIIAAGYWYDLEIAEAAPFIAGRFVTEAEVRRAQAAPQKYRRFLMDMPGERSRIVVKGAGVDGGVWHQDSEG